jgi:RNA polymerase sigma-70 factor, ECF subfamily
MALGMVEHQQPKPQRPQPARTRLVGPAQGLAGQANGGVSVLAANDTQGALAPKLPIVPTDNADWQLVQRCVGGDMRAFELLVQKYERRVQRLIGRFIRDDALVEDLAQETFIRAYRALPQWRGEAQFYTWLYRIAVNTAKKELMDAKRDPIITESALRSHGDDDDEPALPDADFDGETPETALASRQIADAITLALEALPQELRQAVTLREIEGMSYEDIADAMDCPIGTVRSRIFRAREAISQRIKPMLDKQTTKRW